MLLCLNFLYSSRCFILSSDFRMTSSYNYDIEKSILRNKDVDMNFKSGDNVVDKILNDLLPQAKKSFEPVAGNRYDFFFKKFINYSMPLLSHPSSPSVFTYLVCCYILPSYE